MKNMSLNGWGRARFNLDGRKQYVGMLLGALGQVDREEKQVIVCVVYEKYVASVNTVYLCVLLTGLSCPLWGMRTAGWEFLV